jgi:hypothetical protein
VLPVLKRRPVPEGYGGERIYSSRPTWRRIETESE